MTSMQDWPKSRWAILAGFAAAAIGAFLPWVTVTTFLGNTSIAGTHGDGKIVLGLAAVGAIAFFAAPDDRRSAYIAVVAAAAIAAIGLYDWQNLSRAIANVVTDYGTADVGAGLYLVVAGAVVAGIAGLVAASDAKRPAAPSSRDDGPRSLLPRNRQT